MASSKHKGAAAKSAKSGKPAATSTAKVAVTVSQVSVPTEFWKTEPDDHDYPAAESFLSLLTSAARAKLIANELREAPIEHHPAKDLLRATGVQLLGTEDQAVRRDLSKVFSGQQLSPVLIVRGDVTRGLHALIADGYHRVCASYHLSENEPIPCRIVDSPAMTRPKA